jgi:hypothetical protein
MVLWKNEEGKAYPKLENDLIDRVLSELTASEKTMYEQYISKIRDLFTETNKTKCSKCTNGSWNGPDYQLKNGSSNDRGCCIVCAGNKGYFQTYNHDWFILQKVKRKYYDPNNGFFDTSKMRCSLPRQLRSETCLTYACNYEIWNKAASLCKVLSQIRLLQYERSNKEGDSQ